MIALQMMERDIGQGVYHDLSNEEYHACKFAVSNSGLGDILQSPFHYYSRHLDPNRPPPPVRAGQLEGTLAHCAILEPDEFSRRYRVIPKDAPRRPTAAQRNAKNPSPSSVASMAWWDEWEAEAGDAEIITADQYDTAMRQAESVRRLPEVAEALTRGFAEASAFWKDEETGVMCRVRPDWVSDTGSGVILLDVKTYSDASPDEFARQVARKGYARQDVMYSDGYSNAAGVDVEAFYFIAVESTWPFAASVCQLDDESADAGYMQYRDALHRYANCVKKGEWPGYPNGVNSIRMPVWALRQSEQGMEIFL